MSLKIIDACAQLGSGDREDDILESGITPKRILENMDYANVSKSVIYPVTWNNYKPRANLEVYEAVQNYPDRFIGFARVNPTTSDAIEILENALTNYYFKGIRLRPYHDKFSLDHISVRKVFKIAEQYNIPVGLDGEKDKSNLLKLIIDFPNVNIILMHLGSFDNWDWHNSKAYMDIMEEEQNFYLCSCFFIIHFFLQEALERIPHKVIFGSDSPTLPPSMELKRIGIMKLDAEKHAMVVGNNLTRIIGE